jgi:hypothetical protein
MVISLKDNAYHLLGLTGTANAKQILQRSNEIVQRLKIDDDPKYDLDIQAFENYRTEESVKDALRRLQAPKTRLFEYFFWFRVESQIDLTAARCIARGDFENAIGIWWKDSSNNQSDTVFTQKRNFALALTLSQLSPANPANWLDASLLAWSSILDSRQFWLAFIEQYKHDCDLLSEDALADLQKNAARNLSDIYAEIQEIRGGGEFVFKFQQRFNAHGEKVQQSILSPVFQSIKTSIEELSQIKLDETDRYDDEKSRQLKKCLVSIQAELNKVIDVGLYEESSTKLLRDAATKAIRSVSIDIHNHQNDHRRSLGLLEIANKIAGTDSLKALIKTDLEQIQKNIAAEEDNTIIVEVPQGAVTFKADYMIYEDHKIFYKDAAWISYHAVKSSINFIPTSQTYSFIVGSADQTINLTWGTAFYIGNEKKQDAWQKLAGISSHVIQPKIVEKMVDRIFGKSDSVHIGDIELSHKGYSRGKIFGGRDHVSWTERIYTPKFSAGNVILWRDKNGKGVSFATVPMSTLNAVVLPELVTACAKVVANAK